MAMDCESIPSIPTIKVTPITVSANLGFESAADSPDRHEAQCKCEFDCVVNGLNHEKQKR